MLKESGEYTSVPEIASDHEFVGIYLGGGNFDPGDYKAQRSFNGRTAAERIVMMLNDCPDVQRIVSLVPDEANFDSVLPELSKPITIKRAGDTFLESVSRALEETNPNESIILIFSDAVFTRPESIAALAKIIENGEIILPAVFADEVGQIGSLHNLHFSPSRDGYFHLGNMALINRSARSKLDLDRVNNAYKGKSFRTNPLGKLRTAYRLSGSGGLAVAVRIWISANLQHKGLIKIDKRIPSPSIKTYQKAASDVLGLNTHIAVGPFPDVFIDFDYPDDATMIQSNFDQISAFLNEYFSQRVQS